MMCFDTTPARKNVKTPGAGTPSSTTISVSGATTAVSSVPETRPIAAKTMAASSPMPTAQAMLVISSGLIA